MSESADVVIVGGGPVGAAVGLALAAGNARAVLIDAPVGQVYEARSLALSRGTALILERLGIPVEALDATPIEAIHVSQRGGFGRTRLTAAEHDIPALGYVAPYPRVQNALATPLAERGVEAVAGVVEAVETSDADATVRYRAGDAQHEVTARLVVVADGGRSLGRLPGVRFIERDYRQCAIAANVIADPPPARTAWERFTPDGPAALLPFGTCFAAIWTTPAEAARAIARLDDASFCARLAAHFGAPSPTFTGAMPRTVFPLKLRFAARPTARRLVLVGNAAQSLHPVAGQGFNLGMRDAFALGSLIARTPREHLGEAQFLSRYRAERGWDAPGGVALTDLLARGFANDNPLLRLGRGLGLAGLDILPAGRTWLARKMMFGIGG